VTAGLDSTERRATMHMDSVRFRRRRPTGYSGDVIDISENERNPNF
jgi:hypothetical protein